MWPAKAIRCVRSTPGLQGSARRPRPRAGEPGDNLSIGLATSPAQAPRWGLPPYPAPGPARASLARPPAGSQAQPSASLASSGGLPPLQAGVVVPRHTSSPAAASQRSHPAQPLRAGQIGVGRALPATSGPDPGSPEPSAAAWRAAARLTPDPGACWPAASRGGASFSCASRQPVPSFRSPQGLRRDLRGGRPSRLRARRPGTGRCWLHAA